MSKADRDQQYLQDILEAMERIAEYVQGMDYATFLQDQRTQDAVVRNIQVMGEAAKRVSRQFRTQHPELPLSEMARMRDKIVHDYSSINYDIVWNVATQEVPKHLPVLRSLLKADSR